MAFLKRFFGLKGLSVLKIRKSDPERRFLAKFTKLISCDCLPVKNFFNLVERRVKVPEINLVINYTKHSDWVGSPRLLCYGLGPLPLVSGDL